MMHLLIIIFELVRHIKGTPSWMFSNCVALLELEQDRFMEDVITRLHMQLAFLPCVKNGRKVFKKSLFSDAQDFTSSTVTRLSFGICALTMEA